MLSRWSKRVVNLVLQQLSGQLNCRRSNEVENTFEYVWLTSLAINGRMNRAGFDMGASFHLSYTLLKGNSGIFKNMGTFLWNFVQNSGLRENFSSAYRSEKGGRSERDRLDYRRSTKLTIYIYWRNKGRNQTHGGNYVDSHSIFKHFPCQILQ